MLRRHPDRIPPEAWICLLKASALPSEKIGECKHQNNINQHGVAPFGSVFISVAFYSKKSKFLFAGGERCVMICPDGNR